MTPREQLRQEYDTQAKMSQTYINWLEDQLLEARSFTAFIENVVHDCDNCSDMGYFWDDDQDDYILCNCVD
jgi:hypothetical protein